MKRKLISLYHAFINKIEKKLEGNPPPRYLNGKASNKDNPSQ